ncbi:MAG: hypothetical protein OXH72_01200 [Caldilineaceae bacterium]|nr:hypothetical protein [Caldilineaceae bacterium]
MERSKVTFRQGVFAIYLEVTSLKVVSSMKMTASSIYVLARAPTTRSLSRFKKAIDYT